MSMIPLSKGKSHSFTNNYKKDLIEENSHISKLFRTKSFALFNQEEEEDPEMNGQSNNYINDYDEKFFEDEFKGECKGAKTYGGKVNSQEWKASPRMSSLSSEISLKISENIKKIKRDLTEETSELILNSLKKNCIFSYTSETHMKLVLDQMFPCHVDYGQFVFKQGDSASLFFVIEKGTMEVIIDGKSKKYMVKGESFGEYALVYDAPRSASIRCLDKDSILWSIDRMTFRRVVEDMIMKDFEANRRFLEGVLILDMLSDHEKNELAKALIILKYSKNQIIVNEGDQSNSFYIIKEGIVHVYKGDSYIRSLRTGESFGESALLYNTPRQMSIKASSETEVVCLALAKEKLKEILKDQVHIIAYKNLQKWAFSHSKYLSGLSNGQRERIIEKMKLVYYKEGELILAKGQEIDRILIILNGNIMVEGENKIFDAGQILFDENILSKEKAQNNYFVFNQKGKGVITIAQVCFQQFFHEFGNNFEEILAHREKPHEKKLEIYKNFRKQNKMISIYISDLIYIEKLGSGFFADVYLVSSQKESNYYALKVMNKERLIDSNSEKHALVLLILKIGFINFCSKAERKIHEKISFPFIMDYFRTFKDHDNLYFLFEYIDGVTLSVLLNDFGTFETYQAQFYIASMILAVEYLHFHKIAHRDIKPENIMIDKSGYPKIVDLGIGKILTYKQGTNILRTYTLVGTPHYMAPEIPKSKGYNLAVDYWSIGVCLYEFMCGYLPFGNGCDDPFEIYEEISKKEVKFPGCLKDLHAKRLMNQLLNKNPEVRLGGSFMNLKSDPWFSSFDWDKLLEKELQPSFVPPIKDDVNKKIRDFMKKNNKSIIQFLEEEKEKIQNHEEQKLLKVTPNWDEDF